MNNMFDVIIVGAGSAGLTAAIYVKRANKNALVFEGMSYGGQIINAPNIENYPATPHISGYDLATKMFEQAKELGAEFRFEQVEKIDDFGEYKQVSTNKGKYFAKAIILATGSSVKNLGLENEDKLIGRGVGYCATCDGSFYRNKDVAVIGGGNVAVEDAIYLSDIANKVYIILRSNKFRADESSVLELKNKKNIEIIFNSNVTKLNFDKNLESIDIKNTDGNVRNIKVSGMFVAIGRTPANQSYSHLVALDEYGYVLADEKCHTNVQGIFIAGDNRKKEVRQLVTATSDGAISAREAIKYCLDKK